jgi:hypothetical protein
VASEDIPGAMSTTSEKKVREVSSEDALINEVHIVEMPLVLQQWL